MDKLFWLLPALGCGLGMMLCMVMMARMGRGKGADEAGPSSGEVAELRQEVARLRQQQEAERAGADG